MDIHYILLYHIQVDITTAQDEGKLIQQHKTWPCFTTKNNYVRNWISHFPISHSLSLIYIPFLLLLDYRCFVRSVGSDQCHQCQWRHQCTQIEAIDIWWKTKLWIETPNKPPKTTVEIQQWQGIESGFGTDAFGSGRKRPRHFDVGRIKLRVFFQLP